MTRRSSAAGLSPVGGGPGLYLPPRLNAVLRRLAEGATCRQIARELGVSEVTIRGYSNRLKDALDARTTAHAIHRAHQLGLLDDLLVVDRTEIPAAHMEVLRLMAAGLSNARIAGRLDRPEYTVADQVGRLRQRLGARDRGHAVALAMAAGLIGSEDVRGTSLAPPRVHSA